MEIQQVLVEVLDDVLNLNGRAAAMKRDTELLGAIPELDSMSVMAVIAALEERFHFTVELGDLDSATFATFGSLSDFVEAKLTHNEVQC